MARPVLAPETELLLRRAEQEAQRLGHSRVGSEHLLLAILAGGSPAAKILERLGWNTKSMTAVVCRRKSPSAGVRRILRSAAAEAAHLGCRRVLPEHLLLAMTRQPKSAAVLEDNGTAPDVVFTELYLELEAGRTTKRLGEGGSEMRLLEQFCEDMVEKASSRDPVIGRDTEIEAVQAVLCRKNKNNPALIGEPGVGKTAIVEGLAQRMLSGRVPELLQGKRLLSLNMASVLAGTKYRGEFEERIRDLLAEIRRCGNVILFLDEMHTIVGAGSAEGAIDAANLLKPALGRGELQMIGATTLEEYRKHIEKDAALERRFRPVMVREPSREATMAMLEGLRPGLERHHRVKISCDAMEAAVELSCRYLTEHFLPDKAVDLLDEAAAAACGKHRGDSRIETARQELSLELSRAVAENRFEQAARLRDRLQQLVSRQRSLHGRRSVEREDVAAAVAQRTGIPVGKVTRSDRERLSNLREELSRRVLGQEEAVNEVVRAVCRGRLGLADSARPVASLLFLGPTGVGKTALCKALAECVYGSSDAMIRLDMSEFMEQHAVSRLIGAPPGYVGHGEGGELTEKVRRRPYSVVLLDELEKAHRDVTSILLQIMDDGVLTDSMGRKVDFRNTIVVMTSNLGSGRNDMESVGFLAKGSGGAGKALREYFPPEFLGRLDCVTVFKPLSQAVLGEIAGKELAATQERAALAGVELCTDGAAEFLAQHCADGRAGARELRRRIRRDVEGPAAERLLQAKDRLRLRTAVRDGELVLVED